MARRYAEPHRHYHNLQHIADCLAEFDRVRCLAGSPMAVELAIWFHDIIYNPKASDNEEQSAELATIWLSQGGADADLVESVRRLVLATKAHDATLHPDALLMVDVDLSILGQPEAQFCDYERRIRQEYQWVPANVFAAKRARILEGFLKRQCIYHTPNFQTRFETTARSNLQRSISWLRSDVTP